MSAADVARRQRFSNNNRCPICGGYDTQARGKGERCFGFFGNDFEYAHCTREELAGGLPEESSNTYAHRLAGDCRCGARHDSRPAASGRLGVDAPRSSNGAGSRTVATYNYRDEAGAVLYQVVRREPKDFRQRRPDGSGGWIWNLKGVRLVPYRLPEMVAADPSEPVFICEGEKDAEALAALGFVATTNAMGAKKWRPEFSEYLRGRNVVLLPDNDADGREHVQRIAQSTHGIAASGRLRELPEHGDVSDWLAAGGTADELRAWIDGAAPYAEAPPEQPIADTLDAVRSMLAQYVALTLAQLVAITLWIAHTHAFAAASATPYLGISSPEKRSGKTRLLEVLNELVARAWMTGRTSAAALIRKIDKLAPTLLLDESDAAFKGDEEYAEVLRGILNTGHRRGGCASVCVGQGANIDVKDFSTFSAKAIAGIGKLPDTVTDRSIPIIMRRRAPGEAVARFRHKQATIIAGPLRDALAMWAAGAVADLTDAEPTIPDELDDRAADGWEPLLAIADLAGGDWPERARSAAIALSAGEQRDDDSIGVRLLTDIRAIFETKGADRLPSAELAAALAGIEDAPWGAWGKREKPIDARTLARLLVRYGIKPGSIRLTTGETPKGYMREAFEDAWNRYPPATRPSERHTATADSEPAPRESDAEPPHEPLQPPLVAVRDVATDGDSESETAICGGVADKCPATDMGEGDDEHCAACGVEEVWRFTDAAVPTCELHWAAVAHYEGLGHPSAEAVRLATKAVNAMTFTTNV